MRPQNQLLTCTGLSAPTAEIWPPEANSPHPGELEKAVQEPTQVCKRTGSSKSFSHGLWKLFTPPFHAVCEGEDGAYLPVSHITQWLS